MGTLTACGTADKDKPAETKSPSSQSRPPESAQPTEKPESAQPTEKKVGPGGVNSFSPTVTAKPAPTALPGNVITGG